MLYHEFIAGTGCKDNEHNYKVYKDLEIMYMNSDMTKAQIYEYGVKLVDNSKSPEQIAFEREIMTEIDELKNEIESNKNSIDYYTTMSGLYDKGTKSYKDYRKAVKRLKDRNKALRGRIKGLKWCIE